MNFFRFGLFLNSSATDIVFVTLPSTAVETTIAQCNSRCAMARGHRRNTSIVLAAVHDLSGLFRAVSAVEPSLSRPPPPPPPVPVLNKQPRFCGRKAIWSQRFTRGQSAVQAPFPVKDGHPSPLLPSCRPSDWRTRDTILAVVSLGEQRT